MTFPLTKAIPLCTEGGPSHHFQNVAKPGEKPVWQCYHCPEKRTNA
jgi:hypothetical protein